MEQVSQFGSSSKGIKIIIMSEEKCNQMLTQITGILLITKHYL